MPVKRIIILFSGDGSNLENLIKTLHRKNFSTFRIEVAAALTNNPEAKGIEKARAQGIETIIADHTQFNSREAFDAHLVEIIQNFNIDLTVLAGFMRILTPVFTDQIKSINIHPSLLPLFKGAKALEKSFASDMKVAGVTVHEVITDLDAGKIIAQRCFEKDSMDFEAFEKNVHECEYEMYPKAVVDVLRQSFYR